MITGALGVLSLIVIAAGVLYFFSMMLLGWWEAKTGAHASRHRVEAGARPTMVVVLIPCLNEELVIGDTVRALAAQPVPEGTTLRIVVIDDASDDRTGEVAQAAHPAVSVVRRDLPAARQGKGAALNHAYRRVLAQLESEGIDPERVVLAVIDADGRVSDGALALACAPFADPDVGGLQLQVRIRNRNSWLTGIQDLEFWGYSAMTQAARRRTGTVSLGGNGQFARLSALQSVGAEPWSRSLTEDLDLALSLAVRGWRLTTVTTAHVDQQAVTTFRALLRQRTRWFQGHMTCAFRAREVLACPRITSGAAIELVAYLMVPFVLTLPWSLVGQWALVISAIRLVEGLRGDILGDELTVRAAFLVVWYLVGFFPTIVLSAIYRRRAGCTRRRAFALGHLLLLYSYLMYVAAWCAIWRMVRGRTEWTKTQRVIETQGEPVLAASAAA